MISEMALKNRLRPILFGSLSLYSLQMLLCNNWRGIGISVL